MPHQQSTAHPLYCRAKFALISPDETSISLEKSWTKSKDGVNLVNVAISTTPDGLYVSGKSYVIMHEPWRDYIEITDSLDDAWAYPNEFIYYKKAGFISRLMGRKEIKAIPSSTILVSKTFMDFSRTYPRLRIKNPENALVGLLPHYQNVSHNQNLLWSTGHSR